MYLNLPPRAPGRQHALAFLKQKYSSRIQQLNHAWGIHATSFDDIPSDAASSAFQADNSEFLGLVAARYFEVCLHAIRAADPNHLYVGAKFAGMPPDPVLRASHVADVVSVDIYHFDPRPAVDHIYALARRPILVAEFAFELRIQVCPILRVPARKCPTGNARPRLQEFRNGFGELAFGGGLSMV